MWAELPFKEQVKPGKKTGRTWWICLKCGAYCMLWPEKNLAERGCSSCMTAPSGSLAGSMYNYTTPQYNLVGWDYVIPILDLIAQGRLFQCSCNACKGSITVREAA